VAVLSHDSRLRVSLSPFSSTTTTSSGTLSHTHFALRTLWRRRHDAEPWQRSDISHCRGGVNYHLVTICSLPAPYILSRFSSCTICKAAAIPVLSNQMSEILRFRSCCSSCGDNAVDLQLSSLRLYYCSACVGQFTERMYHLRVHNETIASYVKKVAPLLLSDPNRCSAHPLANRLRL